MSAAPALEHFAELEPRVELLAGDDRESGSRAGTRPARPGRGPRPAPRTRTGRRARACRATPDGMHGRQPAMDLDQQIDVGPDRLAHRAHRLHHLPLSVARDVGAPGAGERVELERGEAPGHRRLGLGRVGVRRPGARVPAVGVDADSLAARPAEELHHGHAQALAGQVPQGLLDAADGAPEVHGSALGREIVVGPVSEVADVAGVAADEVPAELPHVRGDRLVAIGLGVGLAPAVQAIGGLDFDEEPVFPVSRVDDERGDRRDFHELTSRSRRALGPESIRTAG